MAERDPHKLAWTRAYPGDDIAERLEDGCTLSDCSEIITKFWVGFGQIGINVHEEFGGRSLSCFKHWRKECSWVVGYCCIFTCSNTLRVIEFIRLFNSNLWSVQICIVNLLKTGMFILKIGLFTRYLYKKSQNLSRLVSDKIGGRNFDHSRLQRKVQY